MQYAMWYELWNRFGGQFVDDDTQYDWYLDQLGWAALQGPEPFGY